MKDPYSWVRGHLLAWLLPLAFIVIGFGGTFLDWQVFFAEGEVHPRIAFFAPLVGFLGLAMLLNPPAENNFFESAAAARSRAQRQRLAFGTFLAGLLAAGVSFALMNGWIGGLAG